MNKLQTLQAIFNYLRIEGEVKTQKDFAQYIGTTATTMSSALHGDERFLTNGLIRKAEVAKLRYEAEKPKQPDDVVGGYELQPQPEGERDLHDHTHEGVAFIPTVPYKVYQETGVNLLEYLERPELPRQRSVSQFAKADCHLFVATDEMHPHMKPGDVLALKAVPEEAPIVNGEIYVVNSQYLGITIRQVYNRGDHYEMRSSQSKYEAFDIPKNQVYCMFRVLGLVRTNIQ